MNQLMKPVLMADGTHWLLSLEQVEQPMPTVCSLHIKPFNFAKSGATLARAVRQGLCEEVTFEMRRSQIKQGVWALYAVKV